MQNTNKYSTPQDFLINAPLYEVIEYKDENLEEGRKLYYFDKTLDSYCSLCNQHSIFSRIWRGNHVIHMEPKSWVDQGWFTIELGCSRNRSHVLFFILNAEGKTIQKIGQLPSLATLNLYDVKKYSKALDSKYFKEFTKAIGLAAHGIGVGSFVYLRRIFEFLIEEAHAKRKNCLGWDESAYLNARMSEKIELLESELPEFLVENKVMYSILSKGIHELGEDECLTAFPLIKVGIEIILDDKLEKINKEKKIKEARRAISALKGDGV